MALKFTSKFPFSIVNSKTKAGISYLFKLLLKIHFNHKKALPKIGKAGNIKSSLPDGKFLS